MAGNNKSYSQISTEIKNRDKPNDVFITPLELAKQQIDMIDYEPNEIWYDPFKNSGSYYNQFPNDNKVWSEILEGRDFFEFEGHVDIICSNPPFSLFLKIINKCIELNPRVISLMFSAHNLTPKRLEIMEEAGYGLTKMHIIKVYKWFGITYVLQFERNKPSMMSYDRTVWK